MLVSELTATLTAHLGLGGPSGPDVYGQVVVVTIDDMTSFPELGAFVIWDPAILPDGPSLFNTPETGFEVIGYERVDRAAKTFEGLTRALEGTTEQAFPSGSKVSWILRTQRLDVLLPRLTGTATLDSGTVAVSFSEDVNGSYDVFFSTDENETLWATAKTASGFTANSSNASSSNTVAWLIMKQ